jgi:hexosaminidase
VFVNHGKKPVREGNWAIYFNQDNVPLHSMADSARGVVEHVNGYLYRFIPGKDFRVDPGDSLVFEYFYTGPMIKESLAPAGIYFVINDGTSQEKIIQPNDITIYPFNNPADVFPDPAIASIVPNAAVEYSNNLHISSLPKELMGKIIPAPFQTIRREGRFQLNSLTEVIYDSSLEGEAKFLLSALKKHFGINLQGVSGGAPKTGAISLMMAPMKINGISEESYRLLVSREQGIRITGNDPAGVFYGIGSLLALVPPEGYGGNVVPDIDCIEINDAPRFSYRGFLLDVARNFQQKEDILKLIDLLSFYKINKLNIRITEDEGWRIEISGLPELTQVGSKRGHTRDSKNWLQPAFGSGPFPDSENNYGNGYYTRRDFIEIIQYAAQRHIQVIPEVCFPSHARAAIKAMEARYDYYMERGDTAKAEEFRLIDPDDQSVYSSAQSFKDNIVCVARPSVYHFYETVVKDFMSMYEEAGLKMTVFNTGGDEVPKGAWEKSPLCRELMKSLPDITNSLQLQGYFLEKTLEMLDKYDLQVTGWEEIVLNKDGREVNINPKFVGKNVMPLVWDNTGSNIDLGYRIANAGYPVVLCNVTNLYFDLAYNTDPKEPGLTWGGFTDNMDPYVMTPLDVYKSTFYDWYGRITETEGDFSGKERLKPENHKNIVGLQAQLWSETLKGPEMMEYYTLPKLFAFAEKAWSEAPSWENEPFLPERIKAMRTGWNELSNRIGIYELPRLDRIFGGFSYRISPPGAVVEEGVLKANVAFPGLTIRYTTDGSEPGSHSTAYTGPVKTEGTVKVRAFNTAGRGSTTYTVN